MTRICPHITQASHDLWRKLSQRFAFGLEVHEVGITDDIIGFITDFYQGYPQACEVYAMPARSENTRGADIDLFIEENPGFYTWYMLQAKIMAVSGRYDDIGRYNPMAQYYTLIRSATYCNALPIYLFYNGQTAVNCTRNSNLGMSVLHAQHVASFRHLQSLHIPNNVPKPTLDDFFPLGMVPFYHLFCDYNLPFSKPQPIDGSQIYRGFPYVRIDVTGKGILTDTIDGLSRQIIQNSPQLPKNLSRFRIIIRSTEKS